jgi:acetyltransferase
MFGIGGIFIEVMEDVAFALAPLTRIQASSLVRRIKGFPLLEGQRGQEAVDLAGIEEALVRIARLVSDFPDITELDLNPVLVSSKGVCAVDVRMKVR